MSETCSPVFVVAGNYPTIVFAISRHTHFVSMPIIYHVIGIIDTPLYVSRLHGSAICLNDLIVT